MSELTGFGLLPPITITDAILASSSVAETDYAAWNGATAYTIGQFVIRTGVHKVFERRTNGTTAGTPETDTVNWREVSSTNRWKMFDASIGSQTTATDSLSWELVVDAPATGLWLGNVTGATIRVEVEDPVDGVVYDETRETTDTAGITDWYSWFFEPIERKRHFLFDDLPPYAGATIRITIEDPGSAVAVGVCLLGTIRYIGGTEFGASVGIKDYSEKEADEFGGFDIVEQGFTRRARWNVVFPNEKIDVLDRLLAENRAEPILYIGSNLYDCTQCYGIVQDYDIVIPGPVLSDCALQLEGMTST